MRYEEYNYETNSYEISDYNNLANQYYDDTLSAEDNNYTNYNNCYEEKEHVHEYSESTKFAERDGERHNHRLAGVTGEAIPIRDGRSHVHKIYNQNTDSVDHYHKICVTTGPAIPIPGTNKHVHVICGKTSVVDGHCHKFLFTTQIESPTV